MARIKFLSDQIYEIGGPGKGPAFKAGQVVDEAKIAKLLGMKSADDAFRAAWLQRWVNRGVAKFVSDDDVAAPAAAPDGASSADAVKETAKADQPADGKEKAAEPAAGKA